MKALGFENKNFNIEEPFKGLFTQGMVCHETYKDQDNNWISPEEIEIKDKKYYKKNSPNSKIIVGPSESMSKSKKNVIDPESIIKSYGADSVRLFQTVLQKKMFNGLSRVWFRHLNLYKNYGYCIQK